MKNGDSKNDCDFIEFATEDQAKQFFNPACQSRGTDELTIRLARHERVVIMTHSDSEEAMEIVGWKFQ